MPRSLNNYSVVRPYRSRTIHFEEHYYLQDWSKRKKNHRVRVLHDLPIQLVNFQFFSLSEFADSREMTSTHLVESLFIRCWLIISVKIERWPTSIQRYRFVATSLHFARKLFPLVEPSFSFFFRLFRKIIRSEIAQRKLSACLRLL